MSYDEELTLDLERRLRRISAAPEPNAPRHVFDYLHKVAVRGAEPAREPIRIGRFVRPRGRVQTARALVGVAAVLIVALAAGTLLSLAGLGRQAAASPQYSDLWSALEWHDITATAFPAESSSVTGSFASARNFASFEGAAYVQYELDDVVWRSTDGQHWSEISTPAPFLDLVATSDVLIGTSLDRSACPDASSSDCATWRFWATEDGTTWTETTPSDLLSHDDAAHMSVVSRNKALFVGLQMPSAGSDVARTSGHSLVTSNGVDWQQASLPTEIATAEFLFIQGTRAGFIATGFVANPLGSEEVVTIDASGQHTVKGDNATWFSPDGVSWSAYTLDPASVSQVASGSLGDAMAGGYHSSDGFHWSSDQPRPPDGWQGRLSSNGAEIVAASDGPVFKVSLGDGRWQTLVNSGDVGSLPKGGEAWAVPGGVVYDAGGHVYFGRALSGTIPAQTLPPAPENTPTLLVNPVVAPLPSVSLAPALPWSGTRPLEKLANGPVGADQIAAWTHGYVAVKDAPAGGRITVWSSADGRDWTRLPDDTFTGSTAHVAAVGDEVMLASWNDGNGVWVSGDGLNWTTPANGVPPIGDLPMAGDGRGLIAAMDEPEGQAMFYSSTLDGPAGIHFPGAEITSVSSVALSGDRWVVVGKAPGAVPAFPVAWWSSDANNWTESTFADAPGQGFVAVAAGRNGFVATSRPLDSSGQPMDDPTLWSSPDGVAWSKLTALPGGAVVTGDGTHLVACATTGTSSIECWSSLDGATWTSLRISGDPADLASIVSAGSSLHAFALRDGVLLIAPTGAWLARAS